MTGLREQNGFYIHIRVCAIELLRVLVVSGY